MTPEATLEILNTNIPAREQEVAGYQFNIENYEAMLAKLPAAWTADAQHNRTVLRSELSDAAALELAQHEFRDELRGRVLDERIQLQRAQIVLEVLIERRAACLAAVELEAA